MKFPSPNASFALQLRPLATDARSDWGKTVLKISGFHGLAKLLPELQEKNLRIEYEQQKYPVKKICEMMGISKPTLYTYVRAKPQERRA